MTKPPRVLWALYEKWRRKKLTKLTMEVQMFRKHSLFGLVSALALLTLAGCAQPAPTVAPSAPAVATSAPAVATSAPAATAQPSPTSGPKYGGTLRLSSSGPLSEIDPHTFVGGQARVFYSVYNRLVKLNDKLVIVPDLAKSWEISSDGLTYTFHLFQGVKFQNVEPVNGREMTADDVVWSLKRVLSPGDEYKLRGNYANVDKYEAPDKYTVKITLKKAASSFLTLLGADRGVFVVPHEAVEKWGNLNTHAVGTGPFILETYDRDTSMTLRKNPDYFEKGLPYLDKIQVTVIPDAAAAQAAFMAQQIDAYNTTSLQGQQWKQQYPNMVLEEQLDTNSPAIFLNTARPPFNDARVRQAINLALDRKKVLDTFGYGVGDYVVGPIPPYSMWALPQAELAQRPGLRYPKDQDIAEAKRLLAEAGYPDGKGLEKYKITYEMTTPMNVQLASVIQDRLRQDLGVNFGMNPVDNATQLNALFGRNYDLGVLGIQWVVDPEDRMTFYSQDGFGKSLWNANPQTEPELTDLLARELAATTIEARQQLVWQAQRLMLDKNYIVYPVNRRIYGAHWSYLYGYPGDSRIYFINFATAWLDTQQR